MSNPILDRLGTRNNSTANIYGMMRALSGDPDALYRQMVRTSPQFADFVEKNKGRSPDEVARSYGIDLNAVKKLL